MKKLIFLFVLCLSSTCLWGQDPPPSNFRAVAPSGQMLYYKIIGTSAQVTDPPSQDNEPSGEIVIPASITYNGRNYPVTSIGIAAFAGCSNLTNVIIPNSVTIIEREAFRLCGSLTSITIPNSVKDIGSDAFGQVRNVVYHGSATGSPWGAFCHNGYIEGNLVYSDNTKTNLVGCNTSATNVTIPNSVINIGDDAFEGCKTLAHVSIPNSVTSLGEGVFSECHSLKSVIVSNSVSCIKQNAFWGCTKLTSVIIPNSVTSIGRAAFENCAGLTNIIIPNSVNTIEESAFAGCSSLTQVSIPNSVVSIGESAFYECESLKNVNIPNSITCIERETFFGCTELTNVSIPNSVTSIGSKSFEGCVGLTNITIPNSVSTIGDVAFAGCSNLTSITIPNSVTRIGYGVFIDCDNLSCIIIGKSLFEIGDDVFPCSEQLDTIICNSAVPPSFDGDFVGRLISECSEYNEVIINDTKLETGIHPTILMVPENSIKKYRSAKGWKEFSNIVSNQSYLEKLEAQRIKDSIYRETHGFLIVKSSEMEYKGIAVILDKKTYGEVNGGVMSDIPVGSYTLKVTPHGDYRPYVDTITIKKYDTLVVEPILYAGYLDINISTNEYPELKSTEVTIDGNDNGTRGNTKYRCPIGKHIVFVQGNEYYSDFTQEVEVTLNETSHVEVTPNRLFSVLEIHSNNSEATTIYYDGKKKGNRHVVIKSLFGEHTIEWRSDCHPTITETYTSSEPGKYILEQTFQSPSVTIKVKPKRAQIEFDKKNAVNGELTIADMVIGKSYNVKITDEKYVTTTITLRAHTDDIEVLSHEGDKEIEANGTDIKVHLQKK